MSDDDFLDLARTRDGEDPEIDPDDRKLRTLRSIWLAMPDEDPPSGGLDALMAAASMKAKAMAPPAPSLWQRFLEVVRRPPVLALASVVVLIGGAVIVKRHESTMDAIQSAPTAKSESAQPAPVPPAAPEAAMGSAAPVVDTTGEREEQKPVDALATGGATLAQKPASPAKPAKLVAKSKPHATAPKPEPTATRNDSTGGLHVKGDDEGGELRESPMPAPPQKTPQVIATDDGGLDNTSVSSTDAKSPPAASADQLLRQCQTAAARGDCAAVRVIADRIQKSSAVFYRDRVVKDAAISKCLH